MPGPSALRALLIGVLLAAPAARPVAAQDNVLVIVLDDVGVERIPAYGLTVVPTGATPVLDMIADRGVLFRNAYSNSVCSPTRSTMLTGRYGFRTGIGTSIPGKVTATSPQGGFQLSSCETSLPEVLRSTHRCAVLGKWHLDSKPPEGVGFAGAVLFGFELHSGPFQNLGSLGSPPSNYWNFSKILADATTAQQIQINNIYAADDKIDDALNLIESMGADPWLVWLSLNLPHAPLHVPPADLIPASAGGGTSASDKHQSMLEAADTEIGRLLGGLRPATLRSTWVIVVGDNGSIPQVLPGVTLAKKTMREFGIHVPLLVYKEGGIAEPGREVEALVNTTDIFASVLDMVGLPPQPAAVDSVSLYPYLVDPQAPSRRRYSYSEQFQPNGYGPYTDHRRAIRDERYKLILRPNVAVQSPLLPPVSFFDLANDPFESAPLDPTALDATEQQAFDRLSAWLNELQL